MTKIKKIKFDITNNFEINSSAWFLKGINYVEELDLLAFAKFPSREIALLNFDGEVVLNIDTGFNESTKFVQLKNCIYGVGNKCNDILQIYSVSN